MKIAYLGSRPLGKKILAYLLKEKEKKGKDYVDIVCIVTFKDHEIKPDGIRWWKNSLIPLAKRYKIPVVPIEKITSFKPEILISIYFYNILSAQIIASVPKGAINLHPGYIPNGLYWDWRTKKEYRGRGVLSYAILNGEKWQAVTFHYITKKIDLGPVIEYVWNKIGSKTTVWDLQKNSEKKAFNLFVKWLPRLVASKGLVKTLPIATGKYTYLTNSALLPLKRVNVNWSTKQIDRTVRAFDFPGMEPAYIVYQINNRIRKIYLRTQP